MQAALLPDRGVVKVSGDDTRRFLNGLTTCDIGKVSPAAARFSALLTPQGKIVVDFIVAEAAAAAGGGFFLDCPKALAPVLAGKLTFYKLRAKVTAEDLSDRLGVMAAWGGGALSVHGLSYGDPRLPALGSRTVLPPELVAEATAELGAALAEPAAYEAHRIALGVPRGGEDFAYGDTFPHEADMDQLAGVDFDKGCYVGQEVVSRVEHRHSARARVVPVAYDGGAPLTGLAVMAGDKQVGLFGSAAQGRALALLRLDRVADAMAAGAPLTCGGVTLRLVKPDWARFPWPGKAEAAE
jgi:folate-binding protein YgfZ